MTRLYGRALTTERVNDYVPDVRFERTSIISALGIDGVSAPIMFKGTLDGHFFGGYVEQVLAPTLSPGDIVIMDNCSAHKVKCRCFCLVFARIFPRFEPCRVNVVKNQVYFAKTQTTNF